LTIRRKKDDVCREGEDCSCHVLHLNICLLEEMKIYNESSDTWEKVYK